MIAGTTSPCPENPAHKEGAAAVHTSPQWYDLHCHVLPNMDDGSQSRHESLWMLRESYAQGVRGIAATPHFYPPESVRRFVLRREEAYQRLMEYVAARDEPIPIPRLCLAAEVAYRPGLVYEDDLEQLCYGKSRYLLLEMPFRPWSTAVIQNVAYLCEKRRIRPVLAHLERFLPYEDEGLVRELLELDVVVQMNAGFLLRRETGGVARAMLREGMFQVLGSDSHNHDRRPPNLGFAIRALEEEGEHDLLRRVQEDNRTIFAAAAGDL